MTVPLVAPLLAAALVVGAGGMALSSDGALVRDEGFRVLTPRDGARVGHGFLLSWTGSADGRYAVVVDAAVPAPGRPVTAGDHVLTVTGPALRLSLGDRHQGSPSARDHHELVVVRLDDQGRRAGEATAVVRVRA